MPDTTNTVALEFLSALLDDGRPVLLDKLKARAAAAGITGQALRAAQRDLGVAVTFIDGSAHVQLVQPRHRPCVDLGLKARTA